MVPSVSRTAFVLFFVCSISLPSRGAETIDFGDFVLDPNSAWKGPVIGDDVEVSPGTFGGTLHSGMFRIGETRFSNRFTSGFSDPIWEGFSVSNQSDTTTPGFRNDASAFAGSGFDEGTDNYAVAFGFSFGLDVTSVTQLETLPYLDLPDNQFATGAYFTNTTYAALAMLEGDDGGANFAKKFGGESGNDPDYLRVSIHGTDRLGAVLSEEVEFYLADFRPDDNSEDFVIDDWTFVDLAPLASADRLYFLIEASDSGTPFYFAMDHLTLADDLLGDLTGDGVLNVQDANVLCGAIAQADTAQQFDLNDDGLVSSDDIAQLLSTVDRMPGDFDFDGEVQFTDFLILADHFGQMADWSQGDLDCDGEVQFGDFLVLSDQFGKTTAAVPEPRGVAMASMMLLGVALCGRRRR